MIKRYQVIYADPPWRYEGGTTRPSWIIENHYPTMALEDIKALEIPAEDNAVLFLWATAPKLKEALEVMEAWGFLYRTCAVWDKKVLGMGHWFRIDHELLLVGRKGKFPTPPAKKRVSSVIRQKRRKHSQKPNLIRTLIAEWWPDASRLEMFARDAFEGWDVWGNEAPTSIQMLLK